MIDVLRLAESCSSNFSDCLRERCKDARVEHTATAISYSPSSTHFVSGFDPRSYDPLRSIPSRAFRKRISGSTNSERRRSRSRMRPAVLPCSGLLWSCHDAKSGIIVRHWRRVGRRKESGQAANLRVSRCVSRGAGLLKGSETLRHRYEGDRGDVNSGVASREQ